MTAAAQKVQIVGQLSKVERRACFRASKQAGFTPACVFLTGTRSALLYGEDLDLPLFVRWRNGAREFDWTFEPVAFSLGHKRRSMQALRDLLADPATPYTTSHGVCSQRGKMTRPVS